MKKNSKAKRIIALSGVAALIGLYLLTLITAILAKPYKEELFMASIFCTFIIPVVIYGVMVVFRVFGREEGEMTIHELRRLNKQMKNMPEVDEEESEEVIDQEESYEEESDEL